MEFSTEIPFEDAYYDTYLAMAQNWNTKAADIQLAISFWRVDFEDPLPRIVSHKTNNNNP